MNSKFSETEPCYQEKVTSDITRLFLESKVEESIDLLLKQKPIDIANLCFLVQRYIENDAAEGYKEAAGQEWARNLEYYTAKVDAIEFFTEHLTCIDCNSSEDWHTRESVKNWLIKEMKRIGVHEEVLQDQVKKLVDFDYNGLDLFWCRCKEVMKWVLDAYDYYLYDPFDQD